MKYLKINHFLAVISIIFVVGFICVFALSSNVYAEEINENENDNQIVGGYDEAKDTATQIVENLSLREYLSKYFDENMTELIITITISVISAFIFLSSLFFTLKKLILCIKKYGVESEATKEVINSLTNQMKDTQKAMQELEETKKALEENNEELKQAIINVINQNEQIKKAMAIAFGNDESLVERGFATEIKEIIEV